MISLRPYQETARDQILESFRYLAGQLRVLTTSEDRAGAIAHNGAVLLNAPTGSGKTVIAGSVAEALSRDRGMKVVWFWFAPFKGLIGQSESSLREKFPGLRIRPIRTDRQPEGTRSGDTWVATWQSVAARDADARKLRADAEATLSIDSMVAALREEGFQVGAIIDEAHHGFGHGTQALEFFRTILRPEFTLLVTATPDDEDAEDFKRAAGIMHLRRVTIGRDEPVAEGLIKPSVRSIAFVAEQANQSKIVDFESTALSQGTLMHQRIKAELMAHEIDLVPLMLVQVDSSKDSEQRVRAKLVSLGFAENQIATHTTNEPDANLLALAVDEEKEVLIFKMAVALGFDAPRAFTLVSMRGVVDPDFGTQIVGRILRVHPRCRGRALSPLLRNAYVFLADCEMQAGLTTAAQKVNRIKTEFGQVSPYALVVSVAGANQLQVVKDGQTVLFPPSALPVSTAGVVERIPAATVSDIIQNEWFGLLDGTTGQTLPQASPVFVAAVAGPLNAGKRYPLREGVPQRFMTQRIRAITDGLACSVAQRIRFDDHALLAGTREQVHVLRREQDVFEAKEDPVARIQAALDLAQAEDQAQRMLLEFGMIDPRELHAELIKRLRDEYQRAGLPIAGDDDALESALALILVQNPKLLRAAEREALAGYAETLPSGTLPDAIYAEAELPSSRHNVYGVLPPGVNDWERRFANLLDLDPDGHVLWWHRNEPHKPWSVATTLPNGHQFFPDFLVGIRGRRTADNVLLVDTKRAINDDLNAKVKTVVKHDSYGATVILFYEAAFDRWMTVRYDEQRDKNELDAVFRLSAAAAFV
ncbi:MAG: DEAD/DEAH box helicase family protein [Opitutus sp.]|nr:DEAD/DEAH box helicase family protein [Opitutus sp.]